MLSTSKRYYLAGPMSGIPQFNFPLFYAVTAELRASGYDIVSPAELDDQEDAGCAMASPDGDPTNRVHMASKTWADYLARDVKLIADEVQGIIFLPHWCRSRGAKLEAFVGLLQGPGFEFHYFSEGEVTPVARDVILKVIAGNMAIGDHYAYQPPSAGK